MRSLDQVWDELFPGEQERVVEQLVDRLVVGMDHSDLHLRLQGINGLASELRGYAGVEILPDGSVAVVRLAISARRRCGRTRLVSPTVEAGGPVADADALMIAVARAFRWQEQIESGTVDSVSAMAEREGVDEAFVRRQLRLTLQPPRAIENLARGGDAKRSISEALRRESSEVW